MALSQAQRAKIKEIKQRYEQEGMKEIKGHDGVWRPTIIGETFRGEYLECIPDADNYHRNKYVFTDETELKDASGRLVAKDGKIALFGGVTLDDRMAWVPIGAKVGVIYCGEKPNPGYKRATKLFTVMSDDELDVPVKQESTNSNHSSSGFVDNTEAEEVIKDCVTYLKDDGNHDPTLVEIADYAEELIEDDANLLDRVLNIIAEELIAKYAVSLTDGGDLNPSEEDIVEHAEKMLDGKNKTLLTKIKVLLAENMKSKK